MAKTRKSDENLIREALAGDGNAFGFLVERYQQGVYALVWSMIHDFATAEDITQEALITALRQLPKLRDASRFPSWLRKIASNTARMWIRKHSGREAQGNPDQMTVQKGKGGLDDDVTGILALLPEKMKQAAVLCYMDGASRKDTARLLGVPEGTLRKRLHDAKKLLQKRIAETAEKNLEEHLLPKDFARRCVCACERAREAKQMEVISMANEKKKKNCGCGCLPLNKTKKKTRSKQKRKKQ
jgi:RNA polymerase sigma factor (sigma-70 family)